MIGLEKKLAHEFFNFTSYYKDDSVLPLNNSRFGDFVDRIFDFFFQYSAVLYLSIIALLPILGVTKVQKIFTGAS